MPNGYRIQWIFLITLFNDENLKSPKIKSYIPYRGNKEVRTKKIKNDFFACYDRNETKNLDIMDSTKSWCDRLVSGWLIATKNREWFVLNKDHDST